MNTEQAKKLSADALSRLMEALERGQSEALKAYLAIMSRFHKYSWGNCLLIHSQFPNATHVGGFQFWLKLGRHVRKGEKGIAILAPMVGKKRTEDEITEDEQTRIFGFRAAHVFDRLSRDFRESRCGAGQELKHGRLVLFWRLTEEGVGRLELAAKTMRGLESVAATRRLMVTENFHVQKPANGEPYRIIDPLGFPATKANEFLEHLEIRGRSPYTLHSYAIALADFLGWLWQADIGNDDVTRHVAGQYITDFGNGPRGGFAAAARGTSKRQPRTVNHRLSVLLPTSPFLSARMMKAGRDRGFSAPIRYRLRSLDAVTGWQAAMRRRGVEPPNSGDECRGGFPRRLIPPRS
jgi:hypothetical protein